MEDIITKIISDFVKLGFDVTVRRYHSSGDISVTIEASSSSIKKKDNVTNIRFMESVIPEERGIHVPL